MNELFVAILNMSLKASVLVVMIVILRLVFKNTPKWIHCFIWILVAIRLVCPISFESNLSFFNLLKNENTQQTEFFQYNEMPEKPKVEFSVPVIQSDVAGDTGLSVTQRRTTSYIPVLTIKWIFGMICMLVYAVASYLIIYKKVRFSIRDESNVYACDEIDTPFILGIIKPKIYVPSSLRKQTLESVLAHERAHLNRGDFIWKPFAFILLTIYWFNPVIWMAYVLFCRDMELACDEKVIKNVDKDSIVSYSNALLECSVPKKGILACPLAFGEVGVKQRIRSVLNYKKPAFWTVISAIAAVIVVAVCFLTNARLEVADSGKPVEEINAAESSEEINSVERTDEMDSYSEVANDMDSSDESIGTDLSGVPGTDSNDGTTYIDPNEIGDNTVDNVVEQMLWPTVSENISNQRSTTYDDNIQYSVNISGSVGDPVYAVADGIIIKNTFDENLGNVIFLQTDAGYTCVYEHLDEMYVEEGQKVKEGDVIAALGNTGKSTGPNLGFSVSCVF
ncbi:MAG: M56 family metallopeptidase [Lachnospiraceae bacterium]